MEKIARFFYHIGKNILIKNHRYFRLSAREKGNIRFYDRDRHSFFTVYSRGFIDSVTANQIYSNNEYNFSFVGRRAQVHERYNAILSCGQTPVIVDCGANIGLASQYFAREFPEARIVAVEPDSGNFRAAQTNCLGYENIKIYNAAIGSDPGFVSIDNASADSNAFQVKRVDSTGGIVVRTVPDLFSEFENAQLFIVKVDIEGFEKDLFSNNTSWIENCDVVIVELHDWMMPGQATSSSFIKAISKYDRDFLFKGESVFSFRNIR